MHLYGLRWGPAAVMIIIYNRLNYLTHAVGSSHAKRWYLGNESPKSKHKQDSGKLLKIIFVDIRANLIIIMYRLLIFRPM